MSEFGFFTSTGIGSGSVEPLQSGRNSGRELKFWNEAYEELRSTDSTAVTADPGTETIQPQVKCGNADKQASSAESLNQSRSSGNTDQNAWESGKAVNAQSSDDQYMMRIKTAIEAFENALRHENYFTAEKSMKEAIYEADKLDTSNYKSALGGVRLKLEHLSGTPEGIAQSTELLALKQQYEARIDLPQELRFQLVKFYLKLHKPDEAKAVLEEMTSPNFTSKYPGCEKSLTYKVLKEYTDQWCQSSIDKAVKMLSNESKTILTDLLSGGLGAAVYAMNPQVSLGKRLLLGLGTGALSKVGLEAISKDGNPTLQTGASGAFNAGIFITCGEARASLVRSFTRNAESSSQLFVGRLMADNTAVVFGSLMYRGARNAPDVFDQANPLTVRQAVAKTMVDTGIDTMVGVSLLLAGRGLRPSAYVPESLSPLSLKFALQSGPANLSILGRTQLGLKALPFAASMFSGPLFEAGLRNGYRVGLLEERQLSQLPLQDFNKRYDPLAGSPYRLGHFLSPYEDSKLKLDEILTDLQQKKDQVSKPNDQELLKSKRAQ